jgi:hypothetical protein
MRFFICGGGCYGSFYLRQLDRARTRGVLAVEEIVVVDRDPECQAAERVDEIEGASLFVSDWIEFGESLWENEAVWHEDHWVPAPIAPHIAYEWIAARLARAGVTVTRERVNPPDLDLPFAMTLDNGSLALSHAPGVCPTNCIEPGKCPLTKDIRDWEMSDTVETLGESALARFRCRHLSFGVGVIPMAEIYQGAYGVDQAVAAGARKVAIATVSSCHGLVDMLSISEPVAPS